MHIETNSKIFIIIIIISTNYEINLSLINSFFRLFMEWEHCKLKLKKEKFKKFFTDDKKEKRRHVDMDALMILITHGWYTVLQIHEFVTEYFIIQIYNSKLPLKL